MLALLPIRLLLALSITGILGATAILATRPTTDMHVQTSASNLLVGEPLTITIDVESKLPVNVFQGELQFNPSVLQVASIDYNTSIADLWAELPWYSNGEGTLNFVGGTTQANGFTGNGSLITVTFTPIKEGDAILGIRDARILLHDGLGTDTQLNEPIDTIVHIDSPAPKATRVEKSIIGPKVTVGTNKPMTDLNNDGKQSAADISIFMVHLATQNKRSDFNTDSKVTTADLSILLQAQ